MPLIWRYLLIHYLRVFALCVCAFIVILLVMRLEEIASFISLGPQPIVVIWFILQQIPYILPIVIPISALISAVILVQSLSQSHELTALRACGFSLRDILTPMIIASLFLALFNFYIISELSTASHLETNSIKKQLRSINPLLLINNKNLMYKKGFYVDTLGSSKSGEFAQDVILFYPGKHENRVNMMVAKQLQITPETFNADHITFLNGQYSADKSNESIMLENSRQSLTPIQNFPLLFEQKAESIYNDHLNLHQLLVRLNEHRQLLAQVVLQNDKVNVKSAQNAVNGVYTELLRRFSISFTVLTFTLLGLAFGISISRNKSNRGLIFIVVLSTLFITCFFAAKSFNHAPVTATLLYLVPHVIICSASLWMLRRLAHGVE